MIKMQIIGHLGKDAEINIHGTNSVINFSVAHTEKYKDSSGTIINKTTWISCAWWTEKTNIAQYLKKGTQIYAEGQPEVKMWRDNQSGENKCGLNLREFSVQILGGKKEENSQNSNSQPQSQNNEGFQPFKPETVNSDISEPIDDLPF